jgi:hypothetical protein
MNTKYIVIGAIVLFVAGLIVGSVVGGNDSQPLGATGARFPYGISADTTSPSAGQVRGTTLTVTGISTQATTSVRSLCVYNGTEFTKITFSGATPSYATSTTCL